MDSVACAHVVDDDPAILRTLAVLLASEGIAAMTYPSGENLLASVAHLAPGCVLTDIGMPGMGGLELVRRLKSEAMKAEAMKAGAADFLVKPFGKEAVVRAVRDSLSVGVQQAAQREDVENYRKIFAKLTPRQRQVLGGIVEGQPSKVIAFEFGISIKTVEVHRADIMKKTRAPRAGALVRMAMLAGM